MASPRSTGCLAVIPARGGSKGIPDKNLLALGGQSLVARAVRAARAATLVDRVVVSTDDERIATEAARAGAEVVDRPEALAGDEVSSEAVVLDVLERATGGPGPLPGLVALVQCTSPVIEPGDVDGPVALVGSGWDSALTVAPSHRFLWRRGPAGAQGVNHDPAGRQRRQDRAPEYVETGAAYAMDVAGFRRHRHRFFGRVGLHVVPAARSHEIDEPADLDLARLLVERVRVGTGPPAGPYDLILDPSGATS